MAQGEKDLFVTNMLDMMGSSMRDGLSCRLSRMPFLYAKEPAKTSATRAPKLALRNFNNTLLHNNIMMLQMMATSVGERTCR